MKINGKLSLSEEVDGVPIYIKDTIFSTDTSNNVKVETKNITDNIPTKLNKMDLGNISNKGGD